MKLRSKEINIFSMSALDLFASAMGAFMLLSIMSMPFFPNTGDSPGLLSGMREELEELQEELDASEQARQSAEDALASSESAREQAEAENDRLGDALADAQAALQKTFVLVVISWATIDDVDLHIVDPVGNEYYYNARRFSGSDAAIEEDNIRGPGNEIWLSPSAMEGTYEVYANMYNKAISAPTNVRGTLLYQNGRHSIPETTLRSTGQKPLILRFQVDSEGDVTIL